MDEAAGVNENIFEAIEGVLTSEHCSLLLLGNPTQIGGTFYLSHREAGWKTFHISAFDSPNFTHFGITEEDIAAGVWEEKITGPLPAPWLITPQWVADKYKRWDPKHSAYQVHTLNGDMLTLDACPCVGELLMDRRGILYCTLAITMIITDISYWI